METIILENARVKVTRVILEAGDKVSSQNRADRVLVFLDDHRDKLHTIEDAGHPDHMQPKLISRELGEVVYRPASTHSVENPSAESIETLIIELK